MNLSSKEDQTIIQVTSMEELDEMEDKIQDGCERGNLWVKLLMELYLI